MRPKPRAQASMARKCFVLRTALLVLVATCAAPAFASLSKALHLVPPCHQYSSSHEATPADCGVSPHVSANGHACAKAREIGWSGMHDCARRGGAATPAALSARLRFTFSPDPQCTKVYSTFLKETLVDNARVVSGRLLLFAAVASQDSPVPADLRNLVSDELDTAQVYGVDIHHWRAGACRAPSANDVMFGFPLAHLDDLAERGASFVDLQAVVLPYDQYKRANDTLYLPASNLHENPGYAYNGKGVLFSRTMRVSLHDTSAVHLDAVHSDCEWAAEAEPEAKDTKYLRHVRMQSDILTKFWGRPMYIKGWVLLPHGWHDRPSARFPLILYHDHYAGMFNVGSGFESRVQKRGSLEDEYAYYLYRNWTSPHGEFADLKFRSLLVTVQHANPFYDDSYAINSANIGPYGDAIVYEFLPFVEREFRGIGSSWARAVTGGSTGGWEALSSILAYPNVYGGSWAFCPDPVNFRSFGLVDIYSFPSAYYYASTLRTVAIPEERDYRGNIHTTFEQSNHREAALGMHARSSSQFDVWQAVFGPIGEDGYPAAMYDKCTGIIDRDIADAWKAYDLTDWIRRNETLREELRGRVTVAAGMSDSFYLNDAVYAMQQELGNDPVKFVFGEQNGRGMEHCWFGNARGSLDIGRLSTVERLAPDMLDHFLRMAPSSADTTSWRY